jgi:hypothetical protein
MKPLGGARISGSPLLYLTGFCRQGLLHILLHSPLGGDRGYTLRRTSSFRILLAWGGDQEKEIEIRKQTSRKQSAPWG